MKHSHTAQDKDLIIKGARVHNLKNISVTIPRHSVTVLTGLSGSGKSSLAFDTIFAEGQRRFVESLSSYARQFLGPIEKPDVDEIIGLSPAISIDQHSLSRSPRSTVGTQSDIYDYLRLLYLITGEVICPKCSRKMSRQIENKSYRPSKVKFICHCSNKLDDLTLSSFSFNSPAGACLSCKGIGRALVAEASLIMPNPRLTINEGAIRPWARLNGRSSWQIKILELLSQKLNFSLDVHAGQLPARATKAILYGTDSGQFSDGFEFEGVLRNVEKRWRQTESDYVRKELSKYMVERVCPDCLGSRLRSESILVTVLGLSIVDITGLTIERLNQFVRNLFETKIYNNERKISRPILEEIIKRTGFLIKVGLGYLTLDRVSGSLSGGESQRIRLATQLGSALSGVIYILDEPSVGLHPSDQKQLLGVIRQLRDYGNTLIIVEHDPMTIESADIVVDIGPGAGELGGQIIAFGSPKELKKSKSSLTGQYLSGQKFIPIPNQRRLASTKKLIIKGAREFNLKSIDVAIPLNLLVAITGVSGSGKSTLVEDILFRALNRHFFGSLKKPGAHNSIQGLKFIKKVISVDQSPIGRTPRSNPATYTGVFTPLRRLFANQNEAKKMKMSPADFSFNLKIGRCPDCHGDGAIKFEMHFLPSTWLTCERCQGRRYNDTTLKISYRGHTIADILAMTVDQTVKVFPDQVSILATLKVIQKVGLGYIKLGQPATTLSGGEAQRVKLAAELSRPSSGSTLYILDEPTTGLHFDDINRLLNVLHDLVDKGNTVLVVEHNLDVIKSCDWVIDLGPGSGDQGGTVVAEGTPEEITHSDQSITGKYLKKVLSKQPS